MSKATVTRLFLASLIAAVAGAILGFTAIALVIANDGFQMSGSDIVGIHGSVLIWSLLGIGVVGGVIIAGAMVGGLASWVGALLNTARLGRKTWFVAMLLLGVFNLGIVAMIAYLIAGPDGTAPDGPSPSASSAPAPALARG